MDRISLSIFVSLIQDFLCMEITLDYINQLLGNVDAWFRGGIDPELDVSNPSVYVIKPISDFLSSRTNDNLWEEYDNIWETEKHISAAQLSDTLLNCADKYNFWDFQLTRIQSASMCIIVFLNYYPNRTNLEIHCGLPMEFSKNLYTETGEDEQLLNNYLKRRDERIK